MRIHAVVILLAQCFNKASSQSKQWYNWYEDNEGKRNINNGILPTLSCPHGHYRQFKLVPHEPGGINLDGCLKCHFGIFGNTTDLDSPSCTAPCPIGTYNDQEGAVSIDDCKPCPVGTYGEEEGLTSPSCSGTCVDLNKGYNQYFSTRAGLTSPERECFMNIYLRGVLLHANITHIGFIIMRRM